jgi:hypothetical protein
VLEGLAITLLVLTGVRDHARHGGGPGHPRGLARLLDRGRRPHPYSITNGIGAGFVAYVFVKLVRGRGGDVHPLMYGAAEAFVLYSLLH